MAGSSPPGGFIQDEEFGAVTESAEQGNLPGLAFAESLDLFTALEAEAVEKVGFERGIPLGGEEHFVERDQFGDGCGRGQDLVLGDVADAAAHRDRVHCGWSPEDMDAALMRDKQPHRNADQGTLPRPVAAQKAKDFSFAHAEGYPGEDFCPDFVGAVDVVEFKNCFHCDSFSRRRRSLAISRSASRRAAVASRMPNPER